MNMNKYKQIMVEVPEHDFDLIIRFPNGKEVVVQARPSNADVDYKGSLDIILPEDQAVTNWQGDDMEAAKPVRGQAHTRIAKQLVTELP